MAMLAGPHSSTYALAVKMGLGIPPTIGWGSVVNLAVCACDAMGFSPVVVCGNDLCYPGGRQYCSGVPREGFPDDLPVAVPDRLGRAVATTAKMLAYAKWLEAVQPELSAPLVNATEGGILRLKRETPLREAVARHCSRPVDLTVRVGGCADPAPVAGFLARAAEGLVAGGEPNAEALGMLDCALGPGASPGRRAEAAAWLLPLVGDAVSGLGVPRA
jgi:hypothetical protein